MTKTDATLDSIFAELGDFGKYQTFIFTLFTIAVTLHSVHHIAFVFSAKDIDYRCKIPECGLENSTDFNPQWLINAVPYKDQTPNKCDRFKSFSNSTNSCSSTDFDRDTLEKCDQFVYKSPEITILNDFKLYCDDNVWKLMLVGTISNIAQFVGLPIAGLLSDRYGRRTVLILGMVFCSMAGISRSFTTSYLWFIFLEFLAAAFGAGTYTCGYILGVELVGPSKRILSGTVISCSRGIGEVLVALLAMWLQAWRLLLLAVYIPPLFLISYFWLTPESIRWLLSQGRIEEAKEMIRKAADVNGRKVADETFDKLACNTESTMEQVKHPLFKVFKSVPLLLRFINCCFCFITCTFLFYGLTINSVALAGNSYVDFILTSLVEIPAYFITYLTLDRWGRRKSQCTWFLMTGISCLMFIFVEQNSHWLQLIVYLAGKFGATAAFTVIYVITSEIFPTPLRHSLMGACAMFGRIGSMVAPQVPLLSQIWKPLPLLLYGIMATIAGLLSLLFPETLNTKLPDTIEEAENIGKWREKTSSL